MSTRAASQPRPKKSAKPKSHQSSKSIGRLRLRGFAIAAGAQRAPELLDLAALPEEPRHAGEDPDGGAEGEEQEQDHDHRRLPGLAEEEAQPDGVGVHERKGEYRKKQERPQKPRQRFDESHQSKTAASCRCRRSITAGPIPLFLVHPLAQFLARLEVRHEFLRYVHPLARFRIAADTRRPVVLPEAA